jgi:hypothetical protein
MNGVPDGMSKICAYPGCETILSRYNDGECCSEHESYNRMARAGMTYAKVPEEHPSRDAKRSRKRRNRT